LQIAVGLSLHSFSVLLPRLLNLPGGHLPATGVAVVEPATQ
jgi:hypothetical protein